MFNKLIIGVFAVFALWVVSQQVQGQKISTAKLPCALDKSCVHQRGDEIARLDSLNAHSPVRGPSGAHYFRGDRCTDDCSGHLAGYNWARRKNIMLTSQCGGNSQSFIVGCMSYASEFGKDDIEDDADGCIPTKYTDC